MTNNEIWYVIDVVVKSEASEAIEFGLNESNAAGTEINNLGKTQTETLCVTGYFDASPDEDFVKKALEDAVQIYGFPPDSILKTDWRTLGNIDWLYEWKKHWKPTETEKFIVAPTWETFDENTKKIVIYIDPAMAFGTGTHETTQLCLKAIEENYKPEMSFFDVGTGTGILTIAAAKLGNGRSESQIIKGCDTDENSIENAIKNAHLNDCKEIDFRVGSISEETETYDFVCANLTIDVITPLLPLLLKKSRHYLVLSGILKEQEEDISQQLKTAGITDFKIETKGMWISVLIKKG